MILKSFNSIQKDGCRRGRKYLFLTLKCRFEQYHYITTELQNYIARVKVLYEDFSACVCVDNVKKKEISVDS